MINPWDIKTDDTRVEDTLPLFIIICEDEISEPLYFRYFQSEKIKVNIVQNAKSKFTNVTKAMEHCVNLGLLDMQCMSPLVDNSVNVWCVFDRDANPGSEGLVDLEFDTSIRTANQHGINVAWSNDAFELWILLHFESIDHQEATCKTRSYYYERLTEIFRNLENKNDHLTKALKHASFNYKQDLKHRDNFLYIVREAILPLTENAITRARSLAEIMNNQHSYSIKCPSTLIHNLVEALIAAGGKDPSSV